MMSASAMLTVSSNLGDEVHDLGAAGEQFRLGRDFLQLAAAPAAGPPAPS